MKKIKQLTITDDHGMDNFYTVGQYGVLEIIEHTAKGDGDKWYYDVITETETHRIFNFKEVIFSN